MSKIPKDAICYEHLIMGCTLVHIKMGRQE